MEPNTEKYRYILSIDIGIKHLALLLIQVNMDYTIDDVIWFELIDITQFHHLDVESKKKCNLFHANCIADWLMHIFLLHHELFELCESIILERQPIHGHTAIEQLFFFKYREKAVLIHPRTVHKFFRWSKDIDYEMRKIKSQSIFEYRLDKTTRVWLKDIYQNLERKHDVSDAYIQVVYYCNLKNKQYLQGIRKNKLCQLSSEELFFEKFRFIDNV